MKRLHSVILSLGCFFAVLHTVHAAPVANIDRASVSLGESFELTISNAEGEPNSAPLTKNFDILSRSKSSQVNIINGRMTRRSEWVYTLMPRQEGTLEIPALKVGSDRTSALRIHVTAAAQTNAPAGELFVETSVQPASVYVQQQAIFTIKLWRAVDIVDGTLSEPQGDKLNLQRLGDDIKYSAMRGNTQFHITERRYAIFPQVHGELTIPAIELNGKTVEQRSSNLWRNDPFGALFSQPIVRTIRVRSSETRLKVSPIPPGTDRNNWLPASQLTLNENWSAQPSVFHVGEPVTRTLTIYALGQQAALLPDLNKDVPGFKFYPDQPRIENTADGAGVRATREQKIALIAQREGTLELPAIQVAWWDTTLNKQQYATLPAHSVTVLSGAANAGFATPPPTPAPATTSEDEETATASTTAASSTGVGWRNTAVAFGLLWLMTLVAWAWQWWRGRAASPAPLIGTVITPKPAQLHQEVLQAAKSADPLQTRHALLAWANTQWSPPPRTLPALAEQLRDDAFKGALLALDNALYAPKGQAWNSQQLIDAFSAHAQLPARAEMEATPLPKLYPHSLD